AQNALEVLAELQAREDDPSIDAEPGKIVHEVRHGKAAKKWFPRYYGTVDATPLYLVLLSETWRWTDDVGLARDFKEPALRALKWTDEYGAIDADGSDELRKRSRSTARSVRSTRSAPTWATCSGRGSFPRSGSMRSSTS